MAEATVLEAKPTSILDSIPQQLKGEERIRFLRFATELDGMTTISPKDKGDLFRYFTFTNMTGHNLSEESNAVSKTAKLLGEDEKEVRRVRNRLIDDKEFERKWNELQKHLNRDQSQALERG